MEKITKEYKIGEDILKIIESAIYEAARGTVDFVGPDPKRMIDVKTGLAGSMQINDAIKHMAINSGLVINASDINKGVTGKESGEVVFTSYVIPFLATIKFTVDTNMDPREVENEEDNPFIKGFRRSSYNYIVTENDVPILEAICIGEIPDFHRELNKIIIECKLADEYGVSAAFLTKYLMKKLRELE